MRCLEIMKDQVQCVAPDDTVQHAARRMRDENIGFLPVCDPQRKVIGTVTDRDLAVRILADGRPATLAVREVMSGEVISCRPDDDLGKAEQLMTSRQKSRIMCIDGGGRLVGVISLSDIAQWEASRAGHTLRGVSQREARE